MPSCCVPTCRNGTSFINKKQGVTFHKFPNDELRRKKWMSIIQRVRLDNQWKPSSVTVICSEHFKQEDIYNTLGGLRRLRVTAVPSNNIVWGSGECSTRQEPASIIVPAQGSSSLKLKNNKRKDSLNEDQKTLQLKSDLERLSAFSNKYHLKLKASYRQLFRTQEKNEKYKNALDLLSKEKVGKSVITHLVLENVLSHKDLIDLKKYVAEKRHGSLSNK